MNAIRSSLLLAATALFSVGASADPALGAGDGMPDDYTAICVEAYWDSNQDGVKDEREDSIGGVPVVVHHSETILARSETNNELLKCFKVESGYDTVTVGEGSRQAITWTSRRDWSFKITTPQTASLEIGIAQIAAINPGQQGALAIRAQPTDDDWYEVLLVGLIVFETLTLAILLGTLGLNLIALRKISKLQTLARKEAVE